MRCFANKVALITGASSGIGRATALAMAERGARVIVCARSMDKLEELAEAIRRNGGWAMPLALDVTQQADVKRAVNTAVSACGQIDILINNAGVGYTGLLVNMPIEQVEKVQAVNFFGVIHCTQAVLPDMIRRRSGQIINVSSVIGKRGIPGHAVYCATKFAVNGLTEALRIEVAAHGIEVILVCPALTDTAFSVNSGRDGAIRHNRRKPRMMSSEAVAQRIVNAALNSRREVVLTWSAKLMTAMNFFCPRFLEWGMAKWWRRSIVRED